MKLRVKTSHYLSIFFFYFGGYLFLADLILHLDGVLLTIVGSVLFIVNIMFLKWWLAFKSTVYQQASWKTDAKSRIVKEIKWSLTNGFLFALVVALIILFVNYFYLNDGLTKSLIVLTYSFILWSITVNLFGEFLYILSSIKNTRKIVEQEKNEVIKLKREVLQDLISPHFLFNSLNTISVFITENKAKSIRIVKELSDLYGFIINNVHKSVVSLQEDLGLAKKYAFLLKSRLESGVVITFDVPLQYMDCSIPPMTLQNLVENCVKHNVVTKRSILMIDIFVENEYIVVKNNLNLKMNSGMDSTNLGLNYIKSQTEQIADKRIVVKQTETEFVVKIPLVYNYIGSKNESIIN